MKRGRLNDRTSWVSQRRGQILSPSSTERRVKNHRVSDLGHALGTIYDVLFSAFGPQHWWPGETRTEMIVGAILTQNTAWTNVERAIERLKQADCLTLPALAAVDVDELADLIRPSGTYRVKAARLKSFVTWLTRAYGADLNAMFATGPERLRRALLDVPGIGPETADAILLYAGGVPTFVVDAYTQRVLRRHFLTDAHASYDETKSLFETHLPPDANAFGEFHALLVELGKRYCRPKARCDACPLSDMTHDCQR